jgi:hypothetical protein
MSRDGYLFDLQTQPLKWTEEELQAPDPNERNNNIIKQAEERRIKRFKLGAPLVDKAIVALNNDSKLEAERLAEKYARDIQGALQAGDLVEVFKLAGKDPQVSKADINKIFNRHLKLVVTDKAGLIKLKYPNGETVSLDKFSGKGSFKTPNFVPKYQRLRITLLSLSGGSGTQGLYHSDGKGVTWGTLSVKANNQGKPWSISVESGKEYYFTFTVPNEMDWTLTIEQSNMDSWVDD